MRLLLAFLLLASTFAHGAEPELLEPEKAFRFTARLRDARSIEVGYRVAPGYYLYRDKFRFSAAPADVKLGAPQLPPGKLKRDEFFGEVETYRGDLRIVVPFELEGSAVPAVLLTAVSQGCADIGVCYVPQEQKAELKLAALAAGATQGDASPGQLFGPAQGPSGADDTRIARVFESGFWLVVAFFFGAGLLLSFTPCMLPMVPILSGVIVGGGQHVTRTRGFLLAAAYVLGMAITYAVAGVAAGLSGAMLAATLQSPWVVGAFAAVFVALALAMLGVYELQLPVALQSRIADASNRLHGGHAAGVFAMGALSALIVGPCVAAPLAGALLYISQSRDVALGGTALFALALGMGAPLLVIGASAGALVPKAGPWMETVKRFFGVLLLGVAIYLVFPFLRGAAANEPTGETPFVRVASLAELESRIQAARGRPVMLDFYADWCVSCKEMERYTFQDGQVRARLDEMTLLQADVTANNAEHAALLRRFRLFGPPGIIFFDRSGREIQGLRVIGFQPADKFARVLGQALDFQ